jgi:hypothetical protein
MMRRFAKRLGANYAWGLLNFTLGVALGTLYGAEAAMAVLR